MRAFRQAERFIYVENQFLWSPEIAEVLREAALSAEQRLPNALRLAFEAELGQ
jgi:hypothetical protein